MSFKRFPAGSRPAPTRQLKEDVFKSLDAVISDRGIPNPRKRSPRRENRRERFHSGGNVGGGSDSGWKRKRELDPGSPEKSKEEEEVDAKMASRAKRFGIVEDGGESGRTRNRNGESGSIRRSPQEVMEEEERRARRFGIGGDAFGKPRSAGENRAKEQEEERGGRGSCRGGYRRGRYPPSWWGRRGRGGSETPADANRKSEPPASTSSDSGVGDGGGWSEKGSEVESGLRREEEDDAKMESRVRRFGIGGREGESGWKRRRESGSCGGVSRRFEMAPRSKATIDPRACSLDDVILDRGITGDSREDQVDSKQMYHRGCGFRRQIRSRDFVKLEEDTAKKEEEIPVMERSIWKSTGTPLSVVNFFSEIGMIIEIKVGKRVENRDLNDVVRKWRCMVVCGDISGCAEAERKDVAKEAACDNFLKNLRLVYPSGKIPPYLMPDLSSGEGSKPKVFVGRECDMRVEYDYTKGEKVQGSHRRAN